MNGASRAQTATGRESLTQRSEIVIGSAYQLDDVARKHPEWLGSRRVRGEMLHAHQEAKRA